MNVKETLETAQEIVLNQRDQQYGHNSRIVGHERIAKVWSGILNTEVTGLQVALCMTGMKLIRAEHAPAVTDSFVDACGYAAIAAEIASEMMGKSEEPVEDLDPETIKLILKGYGV